MASKIEELRLAIGRRPDDPALHYDLGGVLLQQGDAVAAAASYRSALQLAPEHPQILLQLGNALALQGKYTEAIEQFRAALRSDPQQPAAYYNLGNAQRELGKTAEAASSYRHALALNPTDADAHNNLGNVLREQGKLAEAIACYKAAVKLNPRLHHARVHLAHQKQHACDWIGLDEEVKEIRRWVYTQPQAQISPFAFVAMPGVTAAEQHKCAENWVASRYQQAMAQGRQLAFRHTRHDRPRLRIGYLSADFRLHPLAFLISEMIELHDGEHFEVYAYSYGPDDQSRERQRLELAFDRFVDIRALSMADAARRIHADGIDILVDLTGFTQSSRTGIAAMRPAPLQVNWLGFPGTMAAPFFDYLISDSFITPPALAEHYSENLVLMPHCYQPNDRRRPIGMTPSRTDCGLPEDAFVFCCFNQSFKILPEIFEIWMRLLNTLSGSVLWLLECNPLTRQNLQHEAQARGVAAERIVFASRISIDAHLARHALADLFLDTLPYNAHTTTSDALWMCLPVVTCCGETFASRVAGSLLHAAGLPELVTDSLTEYEALALKLAQEPALLESFRDRLQQNSADLPLFNTPAFTSHLEQAYRTMWARYQAGEAPAGFSVIA